MQQLRKLALEGHMTAEEVKNLSSGGGGNTNPALIEWMMGYEQMFTRLIPTPRASDCKGAAANRFAGGGAIGINFTNCWNSRPLGELAR